MTKRLDISELDVVYISFDEPKAEEFYVDLLDKCPWAERVHGIKGFDSAHKAAASKSDTDYFITVDGDNIVDPEFFSQTIEIEENSVYSWRGKNMLNGLIYGNGGLKLWPKELVLNMQTHENSKVGQTDVEFCWGLKYIQLRDCFSEVYVAGSQFQSFRSGFREGVKMSLEQGSPVLANDFYKKIWIGNIHRLQIWCSVGSDVENGLWAIYGARLGCWLTSIARFEHRLIRDYEWFRGFWEQITVHGFPSFDQLGNKEFLNSICLEENKAFFDLSLDLTQRTRLIGNDLRLKTNLNIQLLDDKTSSFVKDIIAWPVKTGDMSPESY